MTFSPQIALKAYHCRINFGASRGYLALQNPKIKFRSELTRGMAVRFVIFQGFWETLSDFDRLTFKGQGLKVPHVHGCPSPLCDSTLAAALEPQMV